MKKRTESGLYHDITNYQENLFAFRDAGDYSPNMTVSSANGASSVLKKQDSIGYKLPGLAEILVVTSYPPRECGIATYSQDLIKAVNNKFSNSLTIKVCALETGETSYNYPDEVMYKLNTSDADSFLRLAREINSNDSIKIVLIQHEFGFYHKQETAFLQFLFELTKPISIVFHTVLPHPDKNLKSKIRSIAKICESIVVMTHTSADILIAEYGVQKRKISVIPHGTHLVPHLNVNLLKKKYGLTGRKVLTTFGLLSSGKSIETTLEALPSIIKLKPEVMFLVIGKTHPEVFKNEGERYREMLQLKVKEYALQDHVRFVNSYLPLPDLLEYLQLTDIYLFTSNDPNQAVSGTFAYAMSCACPIISTPIPHAREMLTDDTGIIFDFCNSQQLAKGVLKLLTNDALRKNISINALQKIVSTSWENSAVAHVSLFAAIGNIKIKYNLPEIKLDHLSKMTTLFGMIQFSKINQPDIETGYTLDDNARALIAICMHYKLTYDPQDISLISKYLNFIGYCQQPDGNFYNYVDKDLEFGDMNLDVNLDDSNGRAIWALGYMLSLSYLLPTAIINKAETIIEKAKPGLISIYSSRAMSFIIKGLYHYQSKRMSFENLFIIETFADRLVQMYRHENGYKWEWFESYLTYANSVMPEALLYAWKLTGNVAYKNIAVATFDFLLSLTFSENGIEVISNKGWLQKGEKATHIGEQPIDVAYTILALSAFYNETRLMEYMFKMEKAFNWFLGFNRLKQIVYNPCTGGCYDGIEETHANLNQGAESTVSYLMARLTVQNYHREPVNPKV